MIITAVRHGETLENAAHIVQGQTFGTLSGEGYKQNERAGYKLRNHQFEKAYISDLSRCIKTGAAILRYHPTKPFQYDERLRERSMKPEEGKPYDMTKIGARSLTEKTLEGESWLEVHDRLLSFTDFVLSQTEQNILLVTHGGPMRVLDSIFTDQPLGEALNNHYDNCAIREWEV